MELRRACLSLPIVTASSLWEFQPARHPSQPHKQHGLFFKLEPNHWSRPLKITELARLVATGKCPSVPDGQSTPGSPCCCCTFSCHTSSFQSYFCCYAWIQNSVNNQLLQQ
ncbi:hypothetical protein ILYODFUR_030592 [Ilyodon furcidens]|uniref:Secreted protein n=1 Tax=Ilyodon furcidens TaxID=33524 RepID=A0ABV0V947_9TELE